MVSGEQIRPIPSPAVKRQRAQRLYFHRFSRRASGTLGAASTVAQLREELRATSPNTGNLVHLEAPAKMLRYDRNFSAPQPLVNDAASNEPVDRHFDGIVLGYANMIRSYEGLDEEARKDLLAPLVQEAEWLSQTRCRIYALGIGLQDELEPRVDAVDPRLYNLLKVLNDRAALFAVRGKETEAWLHAIGLTNAVALGCPSLFVYPRNALRTEPLVPSSTTRLATAGRLQRNQDETRLEGIIRIGDALPTDYVFQNDFFALSRNFSQEVVYDEATGRVDRAEVIGAAKRATKTPLPFTNFYLFRTVDKWRGFAASRDAYVGDRFHGGVVFIQCGVPALIVRNDLRVTELTDFYAIPTATTPELMERDIVELLSERLGPEGVAKFKDTYRDRYADFVDRISDVDLQLFDDTADPAKLAGR